MRKGLWIIAYGNPERRDDGCGWRVAERLRSSLPEGATLRTLHQLDPVLVEELGEAEEIVFVDAALQGFVNGSGWNRVIPETGIFPLMTHHLPPSSLLGMVLSVWGRCPEAWLVSVEGQDFGFGEGLSPEAEKRVEKVSREIAAFAAGEQKG
jgi:hydrogenase maturation protease